VREGRRFDLQGRFSDYNFKLAAVGHLIANLGLRDPLKQQIRYYAILPTIDDRGNETPKRTLLILTTDYLILLPFVNFLDVVETKIL
jgi:hypothetical protein